MLKAKLGLFLTLFACAVYAAELHVEPVRALSDEPVTIEVSHAEPYQLMTLEMTTRDSVGNDWRSWGVFRADEHGNVSLGLQAPLEGSYQGIDGMGLFWSMRPLSGAKSFKCAQESNLTLKLSADGKEISKQTLIRQKCSPQVKRIPIKKEGMVGMLFLPSAQYPVPAIIALSGSTGGLCENRAQLLASRGFAVLALGYFGMEGLPESLENIPLEYFKNAIDWLKSRSEIHGDRIGLYGFSRGAELALTIGSIFPDSVQAIAAALPSSVIYSGLCDHLEPAWTYQGVAVSPSAPVLAAPENGRQGYDESHPISLADNFLRGMRNEPEAFQAAAIHVERIKCPLLVISGGDDRMWPSALFAQQIEERLLAYRSGVSFTHLHYPKAGHQIGVPYLPSAGAVFCPPTGKMWFALGGSAYEDDLASRDSWHKMIAFFETYLKAGNIR